MTQEEKSTEEVVVEAIKSNPHIKGRREEELRKKMEQDGLDLFFKNSNNFITASDSEFEGHYPGNQNNPILIPKKRIVHG